MEQSDRPGPPPGNRPGPPPGDRPGPPRGGGGGPEQTKTLEEIGGYQIGATATDFNLKDVSGKMVSLAGMTDAKGYVVTFTCNECPFAKMYEDRLIELHNKWAPKGYPVVAINSNGGAGQESMEAMQARAKEKDFPFVYLMDEGQEIFPQYGAVRTPHVFVLDQDLAVRYIGAIDDNARDASSVKTSYVEDVLKALSKGEAPGVTYTKAIGCPIKHS
ncbi:thioredoxin family protein [Neolewinella aurantiaca]|uniref:Thioredoxin family protein n=2 Tax=Neolewinella aurantiaca TaxID=2602767 RepID=A0A5C7FSM8_9BACT|nr:thioredoxin family protein [Neolewinella aurantiaca]